MKDLWIKLWNDESGQGLVEYVLIIALVAIGLILVMLAFRTSIGNVFNSIRGQLDAAPADQMAP